MRLLTSGDTLESISQEQFQLARKANISLIESTLLPAFEREAFVNMLLRDLKAEVDALEGRPASSTPTVK